ncbi:MAG: tripartite tricarboxylate transporter permease [Chloroflexota bacterium]
MLLEAFANIFTLSTLFFIALGVFIGYIVGAMPGLGKVIAVAVALPITFYMDPVTAIAFLMGIAKGSSSGNATAAILINTPGEPAAVPTATEGYPMAKRGLATKALKVTLYSATFGDFFSTLLLIGLTIPLSRLATQIGVVEIAAILAFSLTFIAALSSESLAKGLISGLLGVLLALVGLEIETGTPRLTFGILRLYSGIPLIPFAIGLVAVAEMIIQLEEAWHSAKTGEVHTIDEKPEDKGVTAEEFKLIARPTLVGTLTGAFIGILPGLGSSLASFASYGFAKRLSKTPEKFGTGHIEGIAGAESADNAVIPSSLIPLFAFGIPGSAIAAVLSSAFTIHGLIPGPLIFRDNPDVIFGVYASMIVAGFFMLIIGYFGIPFFSKVVAVPTKLLFPCVVFFTVMGAWLDAAYFGVIIMLVFGIVGYFLKRLDFSFVTFFIGFIIGGDFELALRQAIIVTRGESFLDYPVAILFLVFTALIILRMMWDNLPSRRNVEIS